VNGAATPFISGDGAFVVYVSRGTDHLSGAPVSGSYLVRHEVATGARVQVDTAPGATLPPSAESEDTVGLSYDGDVVVFASGQSDLVAGDTNGQRDIFRKELSDAIASVSYSVLLADEPSYQSAIRRYVFENEFKSSENIKLLGWIKSGSSAAGVHGKEQEQLNETVKYLMAQLGYCGKCAFQALTITASSTSILD